MPQTLLLVEDSLTIQQVVERTFVPEGFQVVIANDVQEGLVKLQAVMPDIVLADATMPGMDGFQLCQTLRGMPGFAHVPVLLLTSNFTAYDEAHGERVGVTGYLAKPFESQTLYTLVQRLLANVSSPPSSSSPTPVADHVAPPRHTSESPRLARESSEAQEGAMRSRHLPDTAVPPRPMAFSSDTLGASTTTTPGNTDATSLLHQALGRSLVQMVQEVLQAHLTTMLETLTSQILAEVRQTVSAQVPDLLEVLLQQEIEKLKRTVAQDDREGERERGTD